MKTRIMCIILSVALVSGITDIAQAAKPTTQPADADKTISNTRHASCVLKISYDPTVLPLNSDTITRLIFSTGVLNSITDELMGLPDNHINGKEAVGPNFRVLEPKTRYKSRLDQELLIGTLYVAIRHDDAKPIAKEIMAAICERLEKILNEVSKPEKNKLSRQLNDAHRDSQQFASEFESLQTTRNNLCQEAGQSDLSRDSILEKSKKLENEKQLLEMELAGKKARRDAIQQQIAKVGKTKMAKPAKAETDRILSDMRKQEEKLRELQTVAGKSKGHPEYKTIKKKIDLLRDQIPPPLAPRRYDANKSGEVVLLSKLNEELAMLSIETAEKQARLKFINDRLVKIKDLLGMADKYEREVALQLPLIKKSYETATLRAQELEQHLHNFKPPQVTVIGGK